MYLHTPTKNARLLVKCPHHIFYSIFCLFSLGWIWTVDKKYILIICLIIGYFNVHRFIFNQVNFSKIIFFYYTSEKKTTILKIYVYIKFRVTVFMIRKKYFVSETRSCIAIKNYDSVSVQKILRAYWAFSSTN